MKKCRVLLSFLLCLSFCSCNHSSDPVSQASTQTPVQTERSSASSEISLTETSESVKQFTVKGEDPPFYLQDQRIENCEPIDKSLDCEAILLDRAENLRIMMSNYLSYDKDRLAFDLGETYITHGQAEAFKVVSDTLKTYADFKALFSDKIYGGYIDKICSYTPQLAEQDGELFFVESVGGYIGTFETWYLGFEVTDKEIIGHFAKLGGVEDIGLEDSEYLNDESNYSFYDIIVQNVDGQYVLTDCNGDNPKETYYRMHGWLYNSGKADRSLITNEKVKPKF